jgi:fatty-acid desaturase
MGWVLVRSRDHRNVHCFERYVRDLLRDPFYLELERRHSWFLVYVLHAIVLTAIGFAIGWATTRTTAGATQMAASMFVWGVVVRTVLVLHGTWAVNSVAHVWGYRNYETTDNSRNNWLVALFSHGEGWHNNHHADQRAAAHGHRWWEFDMAWWVIRVPGATDDRRQGIITPARAAERALVSVLITSIRTPSVARSPRRSGIKAPMPPSWMPMLEMFAKLHIAIVAIE